MEKDVYAIKREKVHGELLKEYSLEHPHKKQKKKPRKHVYVSSYAVLTFWE